MVELILFAFTDNKIKKFKFYIIFGKIILFTEKLYFPFFMYKVKCNKNGLNITNR